MMTDPVGTTMVWIAQYGVLGIFGVALLERLLPVIPSQLVLVAIGMGCACGHWAFGNALVATTAAGLCGATLVYAVARMASGCCPASVLRHAPGLKDVPSQRIDAVLARLRRGERHFAIISQLTPMVRILSPGVAGAMRLRAPTYFGYTGIGIVIWNAAFLIAGWLVGTYDGTMNSTVVAACTLAILIAMEAIILSCLRRYGARTAGRSRNA